jgi:hypothetical protein
MKKINLLLLLFGISLFTTLFSGFKDNPDDPPNGNTGSSGSTCGSCHSGGNFGGSVIILGVPSSIAPNTNYSISVTTTKTTGSTKKAGFQLNVINGSGTNVGTLSTSSTNVRIQNNFAEHLETSSAQNFVSTSGIFTKTWTFNWTSPATTTNNNITFYVSSVLGNGASGTSGDQAVASTASGTFASAPAPLNVNQVAKTNVTCKGGANGTATVNATGGTGCSYTYAWSNGQVGQFVTGLAAGVYSVTATCGASTGSTNVTITEPPTALTGSAVGSTLNCVGGTDGTVTASASGGGTTYNYFWSNGATTAAQSNLAAGTYNVTITDNNGCTLVRSANVSNPSNGVSTSISTTAATCIASGTATVTASNGTAPYAYLWSNGQTDLTATGLSSGNHTVTVTDNNGCKTTASATISANTTAPPSSISGNSTLTCLQNSVTLSAPNGNYSYAWSNGDNTASIAVSTANTYTVTVTNLSNGCTSSTSRTITEDKTIPLATIGGSTVLTCAQPQLTLTASGNNSFQWGGPAIISPTNGASILLNNIGTYNLTVTSLGNGCSNSNSVIITENKALPPIPNISPLSPVLTCSNSFATLSSSVSGSFTQTWNYNGSFFGSGTQINANQAGNYTLVVTDPNNGCTSSNFTTVSSTQTTLSVTTTGGKITCATPNVTLTAAANGAVSYNWTSSTLNTTQQNPSVSNQGIYTVVATDVNGCTGIAQATVTNDTQKPTVSASVNGTISCSIPTVTLTASSSTSGLSYVWASNNGFSANGNPTTTQQAGTFTVTATNPANGCSNTANVTVTASNDKPILAIKSDTITCKDTIATIGVTVTGNTNGLTYKWSGVNGFTAATATTNVKISGDYFITVTASNSCSSTATVKVLLDNQATIPEIESAKAFICAKDTLRLSVKNTSNFANYSWSNTSTAGSINISKSGTYSVSVTGQNGCSSTSNITISDGQVPTLSASADSLTCAIDRLIIKANINWITPTAPSWIGPNNFTSSVLQPEVSTPGTYVLAVNPNDGCPSSIAVVVKENKVPPIVLINSKSGFTSCDSLPIVLKVTSSAKNNTFLWTGIMGIENPTMDSIKAKQSGDYVVKVTDEKGCVAFDTVRVTLFPKINTIFDITACDVTKGIANLTLSGGKSPFEVKDNKEAVISSNIIQINSNLFPIVVKDANGCLSIINKFDKIITSPIFIDNTLTQVKDATQGKTDGSIVLAVASNFADFSKNLTYLWSNSSTGKDLSNVGSGKYCVTVSNTIGCAAAECFDIKNIIATEDAVLARLVQVYPNPVLHNLYILIDNSVELNTLNLLNSDGKLLSVLDKNISLLDMNSYPSGIYYLKVMDKKGKFCIKKVLKI